MTMKMNVNPPNDHYFSVMQRIIDGALTIDSIDEFKEILDIYDDDPLLYRRYADLLHEKGHIKKAVEAYSVSADLYIGLNMSLQAIVAKILQWGIEKPSHAQGRAFYSLLHEGGAQNTPIQKFWARMRYSELIAIMLRLVRIRVTAGSTIIHPDTSSTDLYLIVSGSVAEIATPENSDLSETTTFGEDLIVLAENDIFGEIFPLRKQTITASEIKAITDVELVKIAKNVLQDVCEKHPQIESLLRQLYKPDTRFNNKMNHNWQVVRRNMRFGLPTRAEVIFQPEKTDSPVWQHGAIAVDLSLGGVCLDLGPLSDNEEFQSVNGRSLRIRLCLTEESEDLHATGKIVWINQSSPFHDGATLVGVKFDPLNPTDKERLLNFCSDSGGEQNLLWSLWDTMVNPE